VTHPAQPQDPLIGRVLDGRYEMLERIGEGGMGVVYKGRQVSIDRIVAVKMLSAQLARDPNWVARFNREAKACSQLQHPNTIRMFDFGQTSEGRLFMAMEFLNGRALSQVIQEESPIAPERVLKVIIQCCASLAEAHNIGIIHRDIKPDNVFLLNLAGSPDFVKLLDFSVAKLLQENEGMRTQAGVVFGTPQYMSPEQGRGATLDARSDLYALGILAFEMLVGGVPFTDRNPMNVLAMHTSHPVPALPETLPPAVKQIVLRMLEKDPGRRHASATELMQNCQQIFTELSAGGSGAVPAPAPPSLGPPPAAPVADQKTMMAGQSPLAPPSPGAAPAPVAEQKTMIATDLAAAGVVVPQAAGTSPPAAGTPPPTAGTPPPAAGAPPAAEQKTMIATDLAAAGVVVPQATPAAQKTMIATDLAAAGGVVPGANTPSPMLIDHNAPPADDSPKTMILPDSEGLVSMANAGASAPVSAPVATPGSAPVSVPHPGPDGTGSTELPPPGATPLFWAICLLTGLGVGVLAYLAVLNLGS